METFASGKIEVTSAIGLNSVDPAALAPETMDSDSCLPAQYYGCLVARRHLFEGERNLMCAVLQDAIQRYVKAFGIHTIDERREFAELNHWFKARNQVGPFAFESICEALAVDPEDLRRSLDSLARHNGLTSSANPESPRPSLCDITARKAFLQRRRRRLQIVTNRRRPVVIETTGIRLGGAKGSEDVNEI